jgi:uracil-DNA glycosylase
MWDTNTYNQFCENVRGCKRCLENGKSISPPAVFSGGISSKIMLIGQSPGITEWQTGRPFNGNSGRRLFKWLSSVGIEEDWFRKSQYISQVTRCYPGKSKSGSGDRSPSKFEQNLCGEYLFEEIRNLNLVLIIPVGSIAIKRFYEPNILLDDIIGSIGQYNGIPVVALPHPSGVNRWIQDPDNLKKVNVALELIAKIVDENDLITN